LIVRYPKTVPVGTICKTPTSNIDFYPTLCQLAEIEPAPKQHVDGVSILPLLKNPNYQLSRETFYWHYPLDKPHFLGGRSSGAVRKGDWKLIEFFDTGKKELYNLAEDISEKNNLTGTNPEKVTELQGLIKAWRKEVGAKIPEGQSG
jgi:arylsulfatase A-like enzyme